MLLGLSLFIFIEHHHVVIFQAVFTQLLVSTLFWTLKYGGLIKIRISLIPRTKKARKSVITNINTEVSTYICLNSRARTQIMIWTRRA